MRAPSIPVSATLLIALAATAQAGPLADAIARHADADVAAVRAQLPGDTATRCTLGTIYARRGDAPRAMLFFDGCGDAPLPDDIAAAVANAVRDTKKKLRTSELAELQLVSQPPGLVAELAAFPGEKIPMPASVWVKAGTHTIHASGDGGVTREVTVEAQAYSRSPVIIDATAHTPTPARNGSVDFTEDNATEQHSGPPPDVKRPPMMKDKYRGVVGPRTGPELDDPLALHLSSGPRPWFGLRLGAGMFDDGATTAAYGLSFAGAARFRLHEQVFLAARLDWSRRGGSASSSIDTVGASLGAGTTVVETRLLALALIGQLRGDLRFADTRDMAPVRRTGASAAASVELAFPNTPITAGLRFEQGLTELVPGARDRALLVEVGVDLR